MEKLRMTINNAEQFNLKHITKWMPHVLTALQDEAGEVRLAIDFELLKQELSENIVEGEAERYQFNWPGKKESVLQANKETSSTLLPVKEGSVNWNGTSNLYIEGDQLEILKLLQQSYDERLKLIFADFVRVEQEDIFSNPDDGERMRLTSNWLTHIYATLKLSRKLLREDGIIAVCTDDAKLAKVLLLLEELYGSSHCIARFIWRKERDMNQAEHNEYYILFAKDRKKWLEESQLADSFNSFSSWWLHDTVGRYDTACEELHELFLQNLFDAQRPIKLMISLLQKANVMSGDIVLDLFSGHATTAHAIMQMNADDHGKRQYIMIGSAERTKTNSRAAQAGYRTISQIGRERILRAAHKIKSETRADIDYGFRLFRLDTSNMKEIYYSAAQLAQLKIEKFISLVKAERTEEDVLFQVLLELGLSLSIPINTIELQGVLLHIAGEHELIACFAESLSYQTVQHIARQRPRIAVLQQAAVQVREQGVNIHELFRIMSPDTVLRLL